MQACLRWGFSELSSAIRASNSGLSWSDIRRTVGWYGTVVTVAVVVDVVNAIVGIVLDVVAVKIEPEKTEKVMIYYIVSI